MNSRAIQKLLGNYVIAIPILVTLFVSPWNSTDPFNLPKLMLLGSLAPIAFALGIMKVGKFYGGFPQAFLISILLFVVCLFLVLVKSPGDFAFHFYGTPGRNTGFLAYLNLSLLLIACVVAASTELIRKFSIALISIGALMAIYGMAQWQGLDFSIYLSAYDSEVFGTFGNPNFQSAFMGIVAAASMTWALFSKLNLQLKISLLALSTLLIANISLSSEQGYLNFVAGIAAALIIFLFSKGYRVLFLSILATSVLGAILLFLGILNSGPLASTIYNSSLQARGFYWRAAIDMMQGNPFFGVGLESFGDWYRRSRTQGAADFNASIVADTAHSIPLDIGASGGFPLLFLYLFILGVAVNAVISVIRRRAGFDVAFTSIVAAWVAYQAQSLISINQIGLGVWGWSLTGLLIGYEFNTRDQEFKQSGNSIKRRNQVKEKLSASTLLITIFSGAIGFAVSLPPYLAANKYYKALQSGDGEVLQQMAYLKPYDRTRFLFTAQILAENRLDDQAIQVLSDASKIYPDSFDLWQRWSQIPSATLEQVSRAKAEMKRLDPFNPALE